MNMRRKILGASALAVPIAGTGAWLYKSRNRIPDVVRIGVGQPLSTPPLDVFGKDILNGARMAADDLNAGRGLLIDRQQVRLEIVSADDQNKPEGGKAAAASLVEQGVVAAIAHLDSGVSIAAAPIYAAAGVPQLAISTNPAYTQLGLPTTLRAIADDDLQGRAIGKHAAELPGVGKFAVLDDGGLSSRHLADRAEAVLRELNKQVVLRRTVAPDRKEHGDLMGELAAAGVDLLVAPLSDLQIIALMPQLAASGLAGVQILGANRIKTGRLAQVPVPIRALMATSPVLEAREFLAGPAFVSRYRARFGTDGVVLAHYAYDLVHVVADALARNGSVDRARLLDRLVRFDGNSPVTNSIRFTPGGNQRYGAISVYRSQGGRWEPMYRSDTW